METNFEYLKDYPKNAFNGTCRIVCEGLKNHPAFKDSLRDVIEGLQKTLDKETSHLADIGLMIDFRINDLKRLRAAIFAAHDIEKSADYGLILNPSNKEQ